MSLPAQRGRSSSAKPRCGLAEPAPRASCVTRARVRCCRRGLAAAAPDRRPASSRLKALPAAPGASPAKPRSSLVAARTLVEGSRSAAAKWSETVPRGTRARDPGRRPALAAPGPPRRTGVAGTARPVVQIPAGWNSSDVPRGTCPDGMVCRRGAFRVERVRWIGHGGARRARGTGLAESPRGRLL